MGAELFEDGISDGIAQFVMLYSIIVFVQSCWGVVLCGVLYKVFVYISRFCKLRGLSFWKPKGGGCYSFIFVCLMVSLSFFPSFADRIYLKKGGVLLGKILGIDATHYKFKKRSGQLVNVPKYKVRSATFSQGQEERGHGRFFMRLLLGTGASGYNVTLQTQARDPSNPINERVVEASEPHLRVDIEAGWTVVDAHLALG